MRKARIYRPTKTAMQSGSAKTKNWLLEFEPDTAYFIDGLMGWTGMRDTTRQLKLYFPTAEAAMHYAEEHGLDYEVFKPQIRAQKPKSYAENFRFDKTDR